MKTKIYYILLVSLFLLHPFHSTAAKVNNTSFGSVSLSQLQTNYQCVTPDLGSIPDFLDDAIDVDDDDDVSFSSRKKISFEEPFYFAIAQNFLSISFKAPRPWYAHAYIYRKLPCFIALNVLRL